MTAAYHPTAAELDQIRRNSGCAAPVAEFAFGPVFCGQPAVTVWVWEHDMRATDLFPLCGEHLIEMVKDQPDTPPDTPRFIHLSDLMGEPQ